MTKNDKKKLEKLYDAVDEYCSTSVNGKVPVPEKYWSKVVSAWRQAKEDKK
jgi:hypothetical protein